MADIVEIGGPYAFTASIPPTAVFTTITQRTDGSFLVDAKFNLSKDGGNHQYGAFKYGAQKYGPDDFLFPTNLVNADYSINGGTSWQACSAQAVDFRHTAVSPMQIHATPQEFDFVWNAFWDLADDFDGEVILRFEFDGSSITITSSSFTVSTVVQIPTQTLIADRRRAFKIDDFLGEGPIAPWRRGPSDFMMARGKELVKSSVRNILGTRAATKWWAGELPWNPGFGSLFWTLKHGPGDDVASEFAAGYAGFALDQEPRIVFVEAIVKNQEQPGGGLAMFVEIKYHLITSDVSGNQVVLSDLQSVSVEVT